MLGNSLEFLTFLLRIVKLFSFIRAYSVIGMVTFEIIFFVGSEIGSSLTDFDYSNRFLTINIEV
jgi:hypothetical protein